MTTSLDGTWSLDGAHDLDGSSAQPTPQVNAEMTNLTGNASWDAIPQLETTTEALGGPGGPMNSQAQALMNRTEAIAQGTLADAGTVDGSEVLPVSKGGSIFSTTIAKIKAFVLTALADLSTGASLIGFDGTNLANWFAQRVVKNVNSIAELKAVDSTKFTRLYLSGGAAVNDGQQGMFYADASDTSTPGNNATVIVADDNMRWKRMFVGPVCDKWFAVKGDRTTDDKTALQAAISYCLSFTQPKPLLLTGPCLISGSLNIDRPVDSTSADLRIIGEGPCAGLYASAAVTMIDSTIAMPGTDPVSEFVTFDNVHFEASDASLAAYVISRKFLRVQFRGCVFEKIKAAQFGTAYAQTFRFLNNRIRRWAGYFFAAAGSYDIDFTGNIAEHGGPFFRSYDPTNQKGSVGNRFHGNLYEGSAGSFIESGITMGLSVVGNYLEANTGLSMNLWVTGQANFGVLFQGNSILSLAANKANASFYEVQWGNTQNGKTGGNMTDGRLHDQSAMTFALDVGDDYAGIELVKGNKGGITDANRTGINGRFRGYDKTAHMLYLAAGTGWVGLDGIFGGIASTPAVNNGGVLVPMRLCWGSVNPQASPAYYGNPYWAAGSRVMNTAPAVGSPKGWVCIASGAPGTWASEGNL